MSESKYNSYLMVKMPKEIKNKVIDEAKKLGLNASLVMRMYIEDFLGGKFPSRINKK